MSEYIERQKALDTVFRSHSVEGAHKFLAAIKQADVRPVVMCRDCRHWEYDAIFGDGWCRGRRQGNPNWYCADGEKREES